MTYKITLDLTSREIEQILNGLLTQGYDKQKIVDAEEARISEHRLEENDIGEKMATARRDRAYLDQEAAYKAYNKLGALALKLGAIT